MVRVVDDEDIATCEVCFEECEISEPMGGESVMKCTAKMPGPLQPVRARQSRRST
jgi:hypothetical protein